MPHWYQLVRGRKADQERACRNSKGWRERNGVRGRERGREGGRKGEREAPRRERARVRTGRGRKGERETGRKG